MYSVIDVRFAEKTGKGRLAKRELNVGLVEEEGGEADVTAAAWLVGKCKLTHLCGGWQALRDPLPDMQ